MKSKERYTNNQFSSIGSDYKKVFPVSLFRIGLLNIFFVVLHTGEAAT